MCPLGYNNFDFFLTKWSLPDQKWILNGIRRHIYKIAFSFFYTVSAVFGFKASNKCKYFISKNFHMGIIKRKNRCWVGIRWNKCWLFAEEKRPSIRFDAKMRAMRPARGCITRPKPTLNCPWNHLISLIAVYNFLFRKHRAEKGQLLVWRSKKSKI